MLCLARYNFSIDRHPPRPTPASTALSRGGNQPPERAAALPSGHNPTRAEGAGAPRPAPRAAVRWWWYGGTHGKGGGRYKTKTSKTRYAREARLAAVRGDDAVVAAEVARGDAAEVEAELRTQRRRAAAPPRRAVAAVAGELCARRTTSVARRVCVCVCVCMCVCVRVCVIHRPPACDIYIYIYMYQDGRQTAGRRGKTARATPTRPTCSSAPMPASTTCAREGEGREEAPRQPTPRTVGARLLLPRTATRRDVVVEYPSARARPSTRETTTRGETNPPPKGGSAWQSATKRHNDDDDDVKRTLSTYPSA